ncbi:preprotein translocase subunit SecE [Catalinimonas alkaloidigena]|uniref:Protein translocase subunit SecE n=1 Tax=Catalinimonas alkaloidigena TaxID=1075417 RepID=A0A1G9Q8W8_9BACT|nr:preprotein translocase subunit SecE [Catalinimonas alkaloidigena]SDM07508.1 preprotein translocase subunit SecE [Catalinimonas alkaloidigena]
MKKLTNFVKESIEEVRYRVTWPKFDSLQRDTRLVLVASIIFSLVIWAIDFVFENLMKVIYNL